MFSNVDRDSLLEKTIRIRSKFGCCELKCCSQMLREDNTDHVSNVVKLHQDKILYMVPQFTRMGIYIYNCTGYTYFRRYLVISTESSATWRDNSINSWMLRLESRYQFKFSFLSSKLNLAIPKPET